jgi:hypothetical protein
MKAMPLMNTTDGEQELLIQLQLLHITNTESGITIPPPEKGTPLQIDSTQEKYPVLYKNTGYTYKVGFRQCLI